MPSAVSNNMPGDTMRIVHKRHLQELLRNIDPLGQLDEEVEEVGYLKLVSIFRQIRNLITSSQSTGVVTDWG